MSDTAVLRIRVESSGISTANSQLSSLSSTGKSTESSIGGLVTKIGALISVTEGLSKLVETQRQFDVLNAGLITATGSTDKAAQAFDVLQQFAAKTPYTLDQSVEGFTKLVNLGLTPSERAMKSYGDTSAAMGKDLLQMVEAVADASTGEFERLKEFGIKASAQGDKVAFTFRGATTTVKNSASEIEDYLIGLGENNFAGAMETRMATLDGAISNLEDSWNALFLSVSQQGSGEVIREAVTAASDALSELTAMINSGELQGYIGSWTGQWSDVVNTILDGFEAVGDGVGEVDQFLLQTLNGWGVKAGSTSQFMIDAFWEFPANIKALIQIATVELAGFVDKAVVYGKAAAEAMNPFGDGDYNVDAEIAKISQNVTSTTTQFLAARDSTISKMHEEQSAARQLRQEHDESSAKQVIDLAEFKAGSDSASKSASQLAAEQKKADQAAKQHAESVKRTTEAIADMTIELQANKLQAQGNTTAANELRAMHDAEKISVSELTGKYYNAKLALLEFEDQQKKATEASEKQKKTLEDFGGIYNEANPMYNVDKEYAKNTETIKQYEQIQGANHAAAVEAKAALDRQYEKDRLAAAEKYFSNQSFGNSLLMGQINALGQGTTAALSGLISGTMSGTEAIQQLANTIANQAIGAVVDLGVEYVKNMVLQEAMQSMSAASQSVAATTGAATAGALLSSYAPAAMAASIATMGAASEVGMVSYGTAMAASQASSLFAGLFDDGGYIPAGKFGIAAEYGDELVNGTLVQGPANVISRKDTAAMLNNESSGGNVIYMTNHQTIQVTGNGDANLVAAMQQAANQGAQMAYQAVATDFKDNKGIRRLIS